MQRARIATNGDPGPSGTAVLLGTQRQPLAGVRAVFHRPDLRGGTIVVLEDVRLEHHGEVVEQAHRWIHPDFSEDLLREVAGELLGVGGGPGGSDE